MEIKLNNKLSALDSLNQTLAEFGRRHGLSPSVVHDLNLALEEILTNTIAYGYTDNGEHEIKVRLSAQPAEIKVEVEDDGQPFNPLEVPAADITKPLAERAIGGLGIHLLRRLTDDLEYQRQQGRNILVIKKNLR